MKYIDLTKGKRTIVDDEDFEELNKIKWYLSSSGYATNKTRNLIRMHRLVINTPIGMFTDHKNRNRLDNRKENLRICTKSQNGMNAKHRKKINDSIQLKGVYRMNSSKHPFYARIKLNKKDFYLGSFSSEKEAGLAYDKKALELFGEFAVLNFPKKIGKK